LIDWLKDDGTVGATELQRRLKVEHKIVVHYRRVYNSKLLALDKLFGPWDQCFDNLYRLKAQLEESRPRTFVVIDHPPIQVVHLAPATKSYEASVGTPRRKIGVKKKLTPKKLFVVEPPNLT
jgi:hypothetical protein